MKLPLGLLLLAACSSGHTEAATTTEADAGHLYVPYTLGASTSIVGQAGGVGTSCNRGDVLLSGECAAQGGGISSSEAAGVNGWSCVGVPTEPVKGITIEVIVECAEPKP